MSVAVAAFLVVLVTLVAFAAASFFRHTLTAFMVLVAIAVWVVLQAFVGTTHAVLAIGLLAAFAAVIHTVSDTVRLLRTAKRADRRVPPALAEHGESTRRADRSRIAA
jgi:hypothetical protein